METIEFMEARLLDVCTSDYFQGSNAVEVLAIPIWRGMTGKEFFDALNAEANASSSEYWEGKEWNECIGHGPDQAIRRLVIDMQDSLELPSPENGVVDSFPLCATIEESDAAEENGEFMELTFAYVGLFEIDGEDL